MELGFGVHEETLFGLVTSIFSLCLYGSSWDKVFFNPQIMVYYGMMLGGQWKFRFIRILVCMFICMFKLITHFIPTVLEGASRLEGQNGNFARFSGKGASLTLANQSNPGDTA